MTLERNSSVDPIDSFLRARFDIFQEIADRPWFRVFGLIWSVFGIIWVVTGAWELILSQFVPEEYSRHLPKLYQMVGMTAGWISLGVWLMLGALLVAAGAVEWAFRHQKHLELLHQNPITPGAPSRDRAIPFESSPIPSETLGPPDYHWQFDSPTARAIAARLRCTPDWQNKTIVDVPPEYLWNLFDGRTSMQGDKLAEPFLKKWMVVCGPFGDVISLPRQMLANNLIAVHFAFRGDCKTIHMFFNEDWRDRLEILIPGQKIAVIGRIGSVQNSVLYLEDCELVP